MHCAAQQGHWQVLDYLVKAHPEMATVQCLLGKTPLHLTSSQGHLKASQLLLRVPEAATLESSEGHLPLHEAALGGHVSVVRLLMWQPGVMEATTQSLSALHLAARGGHTAVVKLLSENQPDTALATYRLGWTALHLAASYGHVEVAQYLAERWPQLVQSRTFPQSESIYRCDCWPLSPCDGGCSKTGGWLPLHIAAQKGHLAVVKYLATKWPETMEARSRSQHTAFHCAAREGHLKVVQFLLQQVPHQAGMLTEQRQTALHLASARGHYPVVQYLAPILPGKLLEHRDIDGRTAQDKARGRVAELLDELRQTVIVLQVAVTGLTGLKGWRWRWGCPRRARFRVSACTLSGQQKVEVAVAQRQTAAWLLEKLAQLIEVPTDRLVVLFPNGDHLHSPAPSSARKARLGLQLRSAPGAEN